MPRSLWTGSLSFGLINVPVSIVPAVRDLDVHFTQLHEPDGAQIETRRFCAKEDKEVPFEEIDRAYDLDDGTQVVVTDEDLAAAAPEKTRTIDIEQFVDLADVDPIYFDHPYFLVPAGTSEGTLRAYDLLVAVMARTERAALGRFVLRTKEYLALVRVREDALTLTTMLFHDEVRDTEDIDGADGVKVPKKQVDEAVRLIEALTVEWDPSRYEDRHRARLLDVIERKRKGRTIKAPKAEKEPEPVPDLMAALQQALADAKKGRSASKAKSTSKSAA
jgi:DNA end-binding protein Ku